MKSLTVLELSANNISFVPAEVFNSTLENINLSTNYISLNFKTVSKCKAKINLTNNYIPSTFNFKKIFPKATILLDPKDYETNKISVEEH